jgi:hypothetical protein
MARRPCTFKQQDVTRAAKAARAAGLKVERVEIDSNGKIVLVTGEANGKITQSENEWKT